MIHRLIFTIGRKVFGKNFQWISLILFKSVRPQFSSAFDCIEKCTVCGTTSRMYFNPWIIHKDTLRSWSCLITNFEYLSRESFFCGSCGASLRVRLLAKSLSKTIFSSNQPLLEAVSKSNLSHLRILEINEIGGIGSIHSLLSENFLTTTTTYSRKHEVGKTIGSKRNEDICALTFEDSAFDYVVHSDVLEHVTDYKQAIMECYRVVKPGGAIIFTVPIQFLKDKSVTRNVEKYSSCDFKKYPLVWHGRSGGPFSILPKREDYLERHLFGADFPDLVRNLGIPLLVEKHIDNFRSGADIVMVIKR